jgi:RHS repeat-associated protein
MFMGFSRWKNKKQKVFIITSEMLNHDTLSRMTQMSRPNGINTTYSYDALSRLTRMTHGAIEDFQYNYTPDNLIAGIGSVNSATQLPTAKTAGAANQMNQISQFGNASYSFDEKGQTTTKSGANGTATYNWDARGRMTSATLPNGQTVNYSYDALGRRSSRTANNQTTNFIYDGADVIQDKQGASQTNYLNGAGVDDKLRISSQQTGSLYFLTDHLGSTQGLTGVSGNVAEWQRYTPFGESNVSSSLTRYGFTGREKDSDTNLIYYRARWYDAEQGRFISQDPISFAGGNTNLYSYVSNNPISKTDPTGLYELDVHYYLTKYLAEKTGCFGSKGANDIAEGDQGTDEPNEDDTLPGFNRRGPNATYHALHPGASRGVGSNFLLSIAMRPASNSNLHFGRYLHYLQDTFSHEGYDDPKWGHATGFHDVDKTATDVGKTLEMAKSTYQAMEYYAKLKCNCNANPWDNSWDDQIRRFANVKTDSPSASTIDATERSLDNPGLGDPAALMRKRRILNLRDRVTGNW